LSYKNHHSGPDVVREIAARRRIDFSRSERARLAAEGDDDEDARFIYQTPPTNYVTLR